MLTMQERNTPHFRWKEFSHSHEGMGMLKGIDEYLEQERQACIVRNENWNAPLSYSCVDKFSLCVQMLWKEAYEERTSNYHIRDYTFLGSWRQFGMGTAIAISMECVPLFQAHGTRSPCDYEFSLCWEDLLLCWFRNTLPGAQGVSHHLTGGTCFLYASKPFNNGDTSVFIETSQTASVDLPTLEFQQNHHEDQ